MWVSYQVQKTRQQGVGGCVGPSKVKVQNIVSKPFLRKGRTIISSLKPGHMRKKKLRSGGSLDCLTDLCTER